MRTLGCDQHKNYCVMMSLNSDGQMIDLQKFYHNQTDLLNNFFSQQPENTRMAIEACGYDPWLCDLAQSCGIDVHLAHPLKTKAIAEAKIKTDKIDAKILAQLLQANLLPEAYLADKDLREQRYLFRYRLYLVRAQTSVKNRIHALLDRQGLRMTQKTSDLFGNKGIEWLKSLTLSKYYQNALDGYLSYLAFLKQNITAAERLIRNNLKDDPKSKYLMSIPGIGVISAYALLTEIGPIQRFSSADKLCSYAGLVPSVHQSGKQRYHGRITKQGNKFIRWIMIEAAHRVIRSDMGLKQFYKKIKFKKGPNVATVAVARKLLTYVYQVLSKNEEYKFQRVAPSKPAPALPN